MRIHFIGIGGIGISALAQYYLAKGNNITGSDLDFSEITGKIEKKGIKVKIGPHKKKNVPKSTNLVIFSLAVRPDNPELLESKKRGIKIQSYPEALGDLTKRYFTIAVSGTHGKSTTTAMISLALKEAGFDPTVILGTKLREFGDSNCRVGKSKYLVIEADEWTASFLNYWPQIIILTNIEREHLDFYKNLKDILKTYRDYISHLPKDGILILNKDDKNSYTKFSTIVRNVGYYFLKQKEAGELKKILKVPGKHNISNALAVLALTRVLKISDKITFKALKKYRGAWRRFEEKKSTFDKKAVNLISDYGHHPTEIRATLEGVREKYAKKKIWLVFQPHQYQRTHYLFNNFVKTFREIKTYRTIITDIFDVSGREEKKITKIVSSEKLVKKVNKKEVIYLSKDKIISHLKENLKGREVVIIMGAGDIYQLTEHF